MLIIVMLGPLFRSSSQASASHAFLKAATTTETMQPRWSVAESASMPTFTIAKPFRA